MLFIWENDSQRRKRFRGAGEQRESEERDFGVSPVRKMVLETKGGKRGLPSFVFWLSPRFSRGRITENPIPRFFFAPKPNGSACYTG